MNGNETEAVQGSLRHAFTTQDLDLASYLACRGIEPLSVDPPIPNTISKWATFTYEMTPTLGEAITEWSADDPLLVDLHDFLAKRHEKYRLVRSLRGGRR